MTLRVPVGVWLSIFATFVLTRAAAGQSENCDAIIALAKLSKTTSRKQLIDAKSRLQSDYRAQLVIAARLFELEPKAHANAVRLLTLLPKEANEQAVWLTLGDSLCDLESIENIKALGQLRDRLSVDMSQAVLVAPERLESYISHAIIASQDPHSNYVAKMETVCRAMHDRFEATLEALPQETKAWFTSRVFNSKKCKALSVPEAK